MINTALAAASATAEIRGNLLSVRLDGTDALLEISENGRPRTVKVSMTLFEREREAIGIDGPMVDAMRQGATIKPNNWPVAVRLESGPRGRSVPRGVAMSALSGVSPKAVETLLDEQQAAGASIPADLGVPPELPPFRPLRAAVRPGEGEMRIGYALVPVPVGYIEQTRQTRIDESPLLRETGAIVVGSGHAYESYTISYMCVTPREIHMGVKDVLEQAALTPFLTVEGGPFGELGDVGDIPCHEIAVRNMSVSTVPGQPGAVQVDLTFDPFVWDWYTPVADSPSGFERYHMDDMICWPLFKLWARSRKRSRYGLETLERDAAGRIVGPPRLNGRLALSFPSLEATNALERLLRSGVSAQPGDDMGALRSLKSLIQGQYDAVSSRYAKRIVNLNAESESFYVVKLTDPGLFRRLIHETGAVYAGLVRWEKLANWNYVDETGRLLPQSGTVYDGLLTPDHAPGQTLKDGARNEMGAFVDVKPGENPPAGGAAPHDEYAVVLRGSRQALAGRPLQLVDEMLKAGSNTESAFRTSLQERTLKLFGDDGAQSLVLGVDPNDNGPQSRNRADVVIEKISGSRTHNLALTNTNAIPLPIHQYMGGMGATFLVEGKVFSADAKHTLEQMKDEFDARALLKSSSKYSGDPRKAEKQKTPSAFLRVQNEIFQLLGVDFVHPVTLSFQTVDSQPGVWAFSLTFIEHDPRTRRAEQVRFLPTSWQNLARTARTGFLRDKDTNPTLDRAREWFSLQASLAAEEVYPDMMLPSKGELSFWMKALVRAARMFDGDKLELAPAEKEVARVCADFLADPQLRKAIAGWDVNLAAGADLDSGTFVDPDFYCFYHPEQTFKGMFDLIAERTMGKPNSDLSARGVESMDPAAPPSSPIRLHDTHSGVYHVLDHKAMNASARTIAQDLETVRHGHGTYAFPAETSARAVQLADAASDKFQSTPKGWWRYTVPIAGGDDKNVNVDSIARGGPARENDYIPQVAAPGDDGLLEFEKQPDALQDFFKIAWRQKVLEKAMGAGRARPGAWPQAGDYIGNQGYVVGTGPGAGFFDGPNGFRMPQEYKILQAAYLGEDDYFDYWFNFKGIGKDNFSLERIADIQIEDARKEPDEGSFIQRAVVVNSNYARHSAGREAEPAASFATGGSLNDRLKGTYDFFDWIAAQKGQDPNVLRAYFAVRSQMGVETPGTGEDGGWGDFSKDLGPGDGASHVKLMAQTYAGYMQKFGNVPSVALVATDLTLSAKNRSKFIDPGTKQLNPQVTGQLQRIASAARQAREPETMAAALRNLSTLDPNGLLDAYYAKYVEICRVLAPYEHPNIRDKHDPFFQPTNPLIVIDLYAGREAMETKFTPSGQLARIRFERRELHGRSYEVEKFQSNSKFLSAEQDARLTKKLRSAMDPHTEDAIYGALVDLRQHSPFNRLLGAFPSYSIVFVNEGFYWMGGNERLWDQFYTRTGVSSIEVFRSRHFPGSVCNIVFSNMFHQITAYSQMEALGHAVALQNSKRTQVQTGGAGAFFGSLGTLWSELVAKNLPEDVVRIWQKNHLQTIALTGGVRLQVRMGYGANAAALPIVFNGTVADAPVSDGAVVVTAYGDGSELEKPPGGSTIDANNSFVYQDKGLFGIGKSPSNMVTELLVGPDLRGYVSQGLFTDWSQRNSTHFGEVWYEGAITNTAELQLNIYNSRISQLEQQVPAIRNYFNFNALYNWDNDQNDFSIQVNEASTWKAIEVCRKACLDFVASAEPFATRSTLFFGKWWWPFNYGWDASILDVRPPRASSPDAPDQSQAIPTPQQPPTVQRGAKANRNLDVIQSAERKLMEFPGLLEAHKRLTNLDPVKVEVFDEGIRIVVTYNNGGWAAFERTGTQWFANQSDLATRPGYDVADPTDPRAAGPDGGVLRETDADRLRATKAQVETKTLADEIKSQSMADYRSLVADVYDLVQYAKWKPFCQAYIAHSGINLLSNKIRATKDEGLHTDATGLHIYNGYVSGDSVVKTNVWSVDTDIQPTDRRHMVVDTGLLLTGVQSGWRPISENVVQLLSWVPGLVDTANQAPTTPAVENGVVQTLADSVKEMYQDWFMMMGQPSMKPHDLVMLWDHKSKLQGPVFVKEVIHRMDAETGLKTMVSPDLVVLPHSSLFGANLIMSLGLGTLGRLGSYMFLKSVSAGAKAIFLGKYQKRGAFLNSTDLDEYNRVLAMAREGGSVVDREVVARRLERELAKTGKFGKLLDEGKMAPQEYERIARAVAGGDLDELIDVAHTYDVKYSAKKLGGDNRALGEILGLERDIRVERAKLLEDLKKLRISDEEALQALDRMANQKRVDWVRKNLNDTLSAGIDDKELLDLRKELRKLTGLTDELSIAERKRLQAVILRKTMGKLDDASLGRLANALASPAMPLFIDRQAVGAWESALREGTRVVSAPVKIGADIADRLREGIEVTWSEIQGAEGWKGRASVLKKAVSFDTDRGMFRTARQASGSVKAWASLSEIPKNVKNVGQTVGEIIRAEHRIGKAFRAGISGARMSKYLVAAGGGPVGEALAFASDIAMLVAGNSIVEGINASLKARQCVKIIPLRSGDSPWVVGIKGHQGVVIGDAPSWVDDLYTNLLTPGGWNVLGWVASLSGVEPPQYGRTELDSQWLEMIRADGEDDRLRLEGE